MGFLGKRERYTSGRRKNQTVSCDSPQQGTSHPSFLVWFLLSLCLTETTHPRDLFQVQVCKSDPCSIFSTAGFKRHCTALSFDTALRFPFFNRGNKIPNPTSLPQACLKDETLVQRDKPTREPWEDLHPIE